MKLRKAKVVKLSLEDARDVSIYLDMVQKYDLVNPLLLSDFRKLEDKIDTQIWGKEYVASRNAKRGA